MVLNPHKSQSHRDQRLIWKFFGYNDVNEMNAMDYMHGYQMNAWLSRFLWGTVQATGIKDLIFYSLYNFCTHRVITVLISQS